MGEYTVSELRTMADNPALLQRERDVINAYADLLERQASAVPDGWIEGYPNHTYASEWFIAHTIYNDRVVLRALPEEYSYDYTTADGTYMQKESVKRWMQFPDSDFIAAPQLPKVQPVDLQAVREVIADLRFYNSNWSHALAEKLIRAIGDTP